MVPKKAKENKIRLLASGERKEHGKPIIWSGGRGGKSKPEGGLDE